MIPKYYLQIDNDGIARIGKASGEPPGADWVSGSEANYLQRWDGNGWTDTPEAAAFRAARAVEDSAEPLWKQRLNTFAISDDLLAKLIRSLARVVLASVSNVIDKHNALVTRMKNAAPLTQQEAAALTIPVRTFAMLMEAVKQAAISETDPTK